MNQQINEDKNTIDTGVSDFTSFDLLEQPSEFKTQIDEQYKVEDDLAEDSQFLSSAVPGAVSAVVTDTLGAINVLNPLYLGEGDSEDYGAVDYFSSVFDGAISGKTREGEMFISVDDINANPNLKEWINNTQAIMQGNAIEQMDVFRKANNINSKAEYDEFRDRVFIDGEEGPEFDEFRRLLTQIEKPQPYTYDAEREGIIINQNTLPQIPRDADPKFTKDGDLSLPYAGLFGYNDDNEFVMKRPSMFRFTDELTRGKEGPAFLEAAEDYLYPNINASFSYGNTPEENYGYMAGQVIPSVAGLTSLARSGARTAVRGGKGIMNFIRGESKIPFDQIDYRKEPYIASNMDQGLGSMENQMNLFDK